MEFKSKNEKIQMVIFRKCQRAHKLDGASVDGNKYKYLALTFTPKLSCRWPWGNHLEYVTLVYMYFTIKSFIKIIIFQSILDLNTTTLEVFSLYFTHYMAPIYGFIPYQKLEKIYL